MSEYDELVKDGFDEGHLYDLHDGREAILVRTYGDNALLDADPPLTRDEHWIPRPVSTLLQDWLAKGFFGDGPAKLRPHYNFGPPLVTA